MFIEWFITHTQKVIRQSVVITGEAIFDEDVNLPAKITSVAGK